MTGQCESISGYDHRVTGYQEGISAMQVGDIVTVLAPAPDAGDAIAHAAIVVKRGTANVPASADGKTPAHKQPYACLRVFTAQGGELPYLENVPAYTSEADARANEAGKWSAYTCFSGDAPAVPDAGDERDTTTPAAPAPAPVVEQPTFEDDKA